MPSYFQLYEDITGSPPTDDKTINEESIWIHEQLCTSGAIPPQIAEMQSIKEDQIDREDIGRVLTMMHVQKLDVTIFSIFLLIVFNVSWNTQASHS